MEAHFEEVGYTFEETSGTVLGSNAGVIWGKRGGRMTAQGRPTRNGVFEARRWATEVVGTCLRRALLRL